jgi:hypothetical protein
MKRRNRFKAEEISQLKSDIRKKHGHPLESKNVGGQDAGHWASTSATLPGRFGGSGVRCDW